MKMLAGLSVLALFSCAAPPKAADPEAKARAKQSLDLGIAQRQSGSSALAEAYFREALALDPELLDAYLRLGGLLMETDRSKEAIAVYREGSARLPARPELLEDLAFALNSAGDRAGAIESLRRALELRTKLPNTPQNREWIQKDEEGIKALSAAS